MPKALLILGTVVYLVVQPFVFLWITVCTILPNVDAINMPAFSYYCLYWAMCLGNFVSYFITYRPKINRFKNNRRAKLDAKELRKKLEELSPSSHEYEELLNEVIEIENTIRPPIVRDASLPYLN